VTRYVIALHPTVDPPLYVHSVLHDVVAVCTKPEQAMQFEFWSQAEMFAIEHGLTEYAVQPLTPE
jgi:hypothetical protein